MRNIIGVRFVALGPSYAFEGVKEGTTMAYEGPTTHLCPVDHFRSCVVCPKSCCNLCGLFTYDGLYYCKHHAPVGSLQARGVVVSLQKQVDDEQRR